MNRITENVAGAPRQARRLVAHEIGASEAHFKRARDLLGKLQRFELELHYMVLAG
jgi:hypothetical protein